MASSDPDMHSDSSEPSPPPPLSLEEMTRTGARDMLLPIILNFAASSPPSQRQREVTVIVNARAGSITFIEGPADGFEAVLRKEGHLPASKAAIEAMPVVEIGEEGINCAICLEDFELGGEAKEMPCNHRFHSGCIDKWLGIHGSCPLCRYQMPVEEEEETVKEAFDRGNQLDESENETHHHDGSAERRERAGMVFHVFFRTGGRSNSDSDSDSERDDNDENPGGPDSDSAMEIDDQ